MTPEHVLSLVKERLDGRVTTAKDVAELMAGVATPNWFVKLLLDFRLVGTQLSINKSADESGLGVDLLWLSPRQIISEVRDAEPGMTVAPLGFLPIGCCASGSGDPYFLDLRDRDSSDPPVIRVRHDLAGRGEYPPEGLERVASSLSSFFRKAFGV